MPLVALTKSREVKQQQAGVNYDESIENLNTFVLEFLQKTQKREQKWEVKSRARILPCPRASSFLTVSF